jgi:hypothetical protein
MTSKWSTIIAFVSQDDTYYSKSIILFSQFKTMLPLLIMVFIAASGYWLLALGVNGFNMRVKLTFTHFSEHMNTVHRRQWNDSPNFCLFSSSSSKVPRPEFQN